MLRQLSLLDCCGYASVLLAVGAGMETAAQPSALSSRAHLGSNGGYLNTFLAKAFCYACACLGGATAEQVCVHADLARALPPGGKVAAMEKEALAVLPCMG